jgi:hypothetical protein
MIFFKANPTKLLLVFALILDRNNGKFDSRVVALTLTYIILLPKSKEVEVLCMGISLK